MMKRKTTLNHVNYFQEKTDGANIGIRNLSYGPSFCTYS